MSPLALATLLAITASGCTTFPLVDAPVAGGVDVQVVDVRVDLRALHGGESVALAYVPLVPYCATDVHGVDLAYSFERIARNVVRWSGLFSGVTGVGCAAAERRASPLLLRFAIEDTSYSRVRTCLGLGAFAIPLHLVGLPHGYATTTAYVRVECVDRRGHVVTSAVASHSRIEVLWIYGEDEGAHRASTDDAIRVALTDALAGMDQGALARCR